MDLNPASSRRGFTLVELVVSLVVLAIVVAIAVPKMIDLATTAKIAATQEALAAVRTMLAGKYAQSAAGGNPSFPSSVSASDFASQKLPVNKLTGVSGVAAVASQPSGTATSFSAGFWFIENTATAGAYSNGTVDTSSW